MLVLAVFISICTIAVVFLLRFFIAISSELKPPLRPSAARVSSISTYHRAPTRAGTRVPALTLVHSKAALAHHERLDSQDGQAEKFQLRKA